MSKYTSLKQLNERQEQQMLAHTRKAVSNFFANIGDHSLLVNDIWWMFEDPQLEKQHGRAHRIYERLNNLEYKND